MVSVFAGSGAVAGAGWAGVVSVGFGVDEDASAGAVGVASSFFAGCFFFDLKMFLRTVFILSTASRAVDGRMRQISATLKNCGLD